MKKTMVYLLIAALLGVLAMSLVSAAPADTAQDNRPYCPQGQTTQLTEEQKQGLAPLYDQMQAIQQQIMQKYVDYGYITQQQADQRLTWMKERQNYRMQNGFCGGPGRGPGFGPGRGPGFGPGPRQPAQ